MRFKELRFVFFFFSNFRGEKVKGKTKVAFEISKERENQF